MTPSEPADFLEVEDIEVFEALNNPTRFRIVRHLQEPRSVRDVAELFDVPPTRLYYHFNMLEEAGVISVVETRKVGAMLQKLYQVKAKTFRPAPALAQGDYEPEELAKITAGVVLDGARVDAEEALSLHFADVRDGLERKLAGALTRSFTVMSKERARRFAEHLEELIEKEFDTQDDPEGTEYGLTLVFLPLAGSDEASK